MAGDWIKMRTDLAEDPAVIAIADRLGIDEFAVVGRLHRFWSWIDRQSRDGRAMGVTHAWLDRHVSCPGFAAAVVAVGWLEVGADGLSVPNFDRHNGETAKTRALGTQRKQRQRANAAAVSRECRDESVTREEKRREEESQKTPPVVPLPGDAEPQQKKTRKKTATHMTPEWRPTPEVLAEMQAECPAVDVERAIPEFRDYWIGEGKPKSDWNATFRNRIRTINERNQRNGHARTPEQRRGADREGSRPGQQSTHAVRPTARDFGQRTAADILAGTKR
jgi:hypothetical protein